MHRLPGPLSQLGLRYLSKYEKIFRIPRQATLLEEAEVLKNHVSHLEGILLDIKQGQRDNKATETSIYLGSTLAAIIARSLAISVALGINPDIICEQKEAGLL